MIKSCHSDQHHSKGADKPHLPANIDHSGKGRVHKRVHRYALRMVTLRQDTRGNFSARKRLPDDVREEYGRRFGQRLEAKFFAPASVGAHAARQMFRDWETEVAGRIAAIRAERTGERANGRTCRAYTLMRSLSKLMDEAVRENRGVVQGFTGDGVMAVFGAPLAFEDAPLRACRAALAILQRIKTAGPELEAKHGMQPQLRIGLNTGAAVVGKVQEGSEAQGTVLGDTVNFASRVQSLAKPDVAYMSDATHRLVQGLVDASFAGEHAVKGK